MSLRHAARLFPAFLRAASVPRLLVSQPRHTAALTTATAAAGQSRARTPNRTRVVRRARPAPSPRNSAPPRRRLATYRTVVPDGVEHPLKADVSPVDPAAAAAPRPVPRDAEGRVLLKDMTLAELEAWVADDLGDKPFRARQLWRWLYAPGRVVGTFDEMTDLSLSFRERLSREARVDSLRMHEVHDSDDGTKKLTFRVDGGGVIETVVIPADGRTTICVSSQWGCALNCQFCLTGRTGFKRSLSSGEIVDQVVLAKRLLEREGGPVGRIGNVVFMGEGEPAHNVDNVLRAVETMVHGHGLHIGHNKVTVSTSGLVPEIRRLARECKANLAVSLHATNDELRSWLMPINRKYPLGELMQVLRDEFPRSTMRQQKVFFQYVMLKGVNDSLEDARELLRLTAGVPCKINLIHFNAHEGTEFEASDDATMLAFQDYLVRKGLTVTVRRSRGDDKMMACGQLGTLGERQAPRMRVPQRYAHAVAGRERGDAESPTAQARAQ